MVGNIDLLTISGAQMIEKYQFEIWNESQSILPYTDDGFSDNQWIITLMCVRLQTFTLTTTPSTDRTHILFVSENVDIIELI